MNVVALDPYASPSVAAAANVTLVPSMAALLPLADFLTIHTPLIASTKGMISTAELAQRRPGLVRNVMTENPDLTRSNGIEPCDQ